MIKETITFTFADKTQRALFHKRLRGDACVVSSSVADDAIETMKLRVRGLEMSFVRHSKFVSDLRSSAVQQGDKMVIRREDWGNLFERLWG